MNMFPRDTCGISNLRDTWAKTSVARKDGAEMKELLQSVVLRKENMGTQKYAIVRKMNALILPAAIVRC